jgi:hypothetical protein
VATSLCAIVLTGLSGTYHNVKRGSVHLPAAAAVGGSAMVAMYFTATYITLGVSEQHRAPARRAHGLHSPVRRLWSFRQHLPKSIGFSRHASQEYCQSLQMPP